MRAPDELDTGAVGAGGGAFTVIPGNSMGGETEIWADAVEEKIALTAKPEIPEVDARSSMISLSFQYICCHKKLLSEGSGVVIVKME